MSRTPMQRDPETGLEIAVVGYAGRFPGAASVPDLWRLLEAGEEGLTRFTDDQLAAAGVPPELLRRPEYVPVRGVLEGGDTFDAELFGYGPREAEIMDPQQRVFLECAFHALEDAGYDPARSPFPIGVWGSCGLSSYIGRFYTDPRLVERFGVHALALANDKDFLCTRVAYKLGLEGPAVTVQTACSSSLVAVHMACQGLLAGECDLALAGGVSVSFPQTRGYLYQPGGIVSPDGCTRTFDAGAAGAVSGHGVALVVLKRLEDALADGDSVRAVIRGSALANDGSRRAGFTAPSQEGQARALRAAYQMAQVDPATVTYVEAHGTATELGDPIEVAALRQAFEAEADALGGAPVSLEDGTPAPCWLGSVKTNLGHLDAAAGVAGLIKAVLALEHGTIPPSLHFQNPNPRLPLGDDGRLRVAAEGIPWSRPRRQGAVLPRRAGVSSFGLGGTNAHVILEEAPSLTPPLPGTSEGRDQLLLVSAGDDSARDQLAAALARSLTPASSAAPLAAAAHTLRHGRRFQAHRLAVVAADGAEAAARLAGEDPAERLLGGAAAAPPPVVMLLPGVGDQYPGLGHQLYQQEPVFRRMVDRCAAVLDREVGEDPRRWLRQAPTATATSSGPDLRAMLGRGGAGAQSPAAGSSKETMSPLAAQLLVFTVEQALVALWRSWGVEPSAVVGYSLGELSAACAAGALDLETALVFVARRGRLMEAVPGGALLAVPLGEEDARPHLEGVGGELYPMADNAPNSCVVAGSTAAVAELEARLEAAGIAHRRVGSDRPVHTPLAATTAAELARFAPALKAPSVPWASTVTGGLVAPEAGADPADNDLWVRQWTSKVRFREALSAAVTAARRAAGGAVDAPVVLLEAGPGQALGSYALASGELVAGGDLTALPSLPFAYDRQSARRFLLRTLGRLWIAGIPVDWDAFDAVDSDDAAAVRRVPLPLTPLRRQRYWIDGVDADGIDGAAADGADGGDASGIGGAGSGASAEPWQRLDDPARRFLVPVWAPVPAFGGEHGGEDVSEDSDEDSPRRWWVAPLESSGDAGEIADGMVAALGADGEDGRRLPVPDTASRGTWRTALEVLATEGSAALVLVASSPESLPSADPVAALDAARQGPLAALFSFAELWASAGAATAGARCSALVVVPGAAGVLGVPAPERAMLAAAARSLGQESLGLELRLLDPGPAAPAQTPADGVVAGASGRALVRAARRELAAPLDHRFVALGAGGLRHVRRWEPLTLPPADPQRLPSPGGVHWISGGLGGLGVGLARHLARRAADAEADLHLVLASRRGLAVEGDEGQRRRAAVEELSAAGATVTVQTVDVAASDALATALEEAAALGPWAAIYHLAGRPGGGLMALRSAAAVDSVLGPKAGAAAALWRALQRIPSPPAAVVLFSSTAAAVGGVGQGDYAAANRYLGALAQAASADPNPAAPRWLTVDWDEWQWDAWRAGREDLPASLLVNLDAQRQRYGLREEEGFAALDRALAVALRGPELPRVIVSTRDLREWLVASGPGLEQLTGPAGFTSSGSVLAPDAGTQDRHRRPALAVEYVAPRGDDERALALLWEDLLGVSPVGTHDSFLDLGGHSLLALQLIARLREEHGRSLDLREVFQTPTIAALAQRLAATDGAVDEDDVIRPVGAESMVPVDAESGAGSKAGAGASPEVLSDDDIADLSPEELDALLGDLTGDDALEEELEEELTRLASGDAAPGDAATGDAAPGTAAGGDDT